jgi:hypothetical protein
MLLYDKIKIDDAAQVRVTEHGYLTAMPRVARTGIQLYGGDEVGRPDIKVVRVYRPETEVFHNDSLHSYPHKPVTNDHPPEAVTVDNWKKYAAGGIGDEVLRDGDHIRVPMTMMDKGLVKDYQDGKSELSMGYTCDLDWTAGTTPRGEPYDAVQRNIRANHLAVVDAARGGSALRIGDFHMENEDMTTVTDNTPKVSITIDSVPLTLDAVSASVINAHLERARKNLEGLQEKLGESEKAAKSGKDSLDAAVAKHTTEIAAKDAKITELEKQVKDAAITPDKLDAMVADRERVVAVAKAVLGDKLVVKDKTIPDIKKQVVDARLGDKAKGWNDIQYDTSFDTLTADIKPGEAAMSTTQHQPGGGGASVLDVARAFSHQNQPSTNATDAAYAKRDQELSDAWKTPPGRA